VVLSCRAVEAEASISFAGLSDLLAGVDESALTSLRAPRKHALGVALLLEDPGSQPPDQRAVSLALLDILGALARPTPVVVAADGWAAVACPARSDGAARRPPRAPPRVDARAPAGDRGVATPDGRSARGGTCG